MLTQKYTLGTTFQLSDSQNKMADVCGDCGCDVPKNQWICDTCYDLREKLDTDVLWREDDANEIKKIDEIIDEWRARRGYKGAQAAAAGISEAKIEKRKTKAVWAKLLRGNASRALRNLKRIRQEAADAIEQVEDDLASQNERIARLEAKIAV